MKGCDWAENIEKVIDISKTSMPLKGEYDWSDISALAKLSNILTIRR